MSISFASRTKYIENRQAVAAEIRSKPLPNITVNTLSVAPTAAAPRQSFVQSAPRASNGSRLPRPSAFGIPVVVQAGTSDMRHSAPERRTSLGLTDTEIDARIARLVEAEVERRLVDKARLDEIAASEREAEARKDKENQSQDQQACLAARLAELERKL